MKRKLNVWDRGVCGERMGVGERDGVKNGSKYLFLIGILFIYGMGVGLGSLGVCLGF